MDISPPFHSIPSLISKTGEEFKHFCDSDWRFAPLLNTPHTWFQNVRTKFHSLIWMLAERVWVLLVNNSVFLLFNKTERDRWWGRGSSKVVIDLWHVRRRKLCAQSIHIHPSIRELLFIHKKSMAIALIRTHNSFPVSNNAVYLTTTKYHVTRICNNVARPTLYIHQ